MPSVDVGHAAPPLSLALLPLLPMHRLFAGKRDQEPKRGNLIFAALSREEEWKEGGKV